MSGSKRPNRPPTKIETINEVLGQFTSDSDEAEELRQELAEVLSANMDLESEVRAANVRNYALTLNTDKIMMDVLVRAIFPREEDRIRLQISFQKELTVALNRLSEEVAEAHAPKIELPKLPDLRLTN